MFGSSYPRVDISPSNCVLSFVCLFCFVYLFACLSAVSFFFFFFVFFVMVIFFLLACSSIYWTFVCFVVIIYCCRYCFLETNLKFYIFNAFFFN